MSPFHSPSHVHAPVSMPPAVHHSSPAGLMHPYDAAHPYDIPAASPFAAVESETPDWPMGSAAPEDPNDYLMRASAQGRLDAEARQQQDQEQPAGPSSAEFASHESSFSPTWNYMNPASSNYPYDSHYDSDMNH